MATVGSDGKEGNDTGKEGKDGSDTGKEGSDGGETGKEASDPGNVDTGAHPVYEQGLLEGVPIIPRRLVRVEVTPTPRGLESLSSSPPPEEQEQSAAYWSLVEGFGILAGFTRESGLQSNLTLSVADDDEARAIAGNDPLVQSGLMEITAVGPFE